MRSLFSVVQTISSMYDHTQGWYIGEWTSQRFGKDSGWFQKSLWKPWSARKSHCLRLYLYFLLCIRPIGACTVAAFVQSVLAALTFSVYNERYPVQVKKVKKQLSRNQNHRCFIAINLDLFQLINFISLRLVSILLPFSNPWFLHFFNFVLRFSMKERFILFLFFFFFCILFRVLFLFFGLWPFAFIWMH